MNKPEKLNLNRYPTPFHELKNLREYLGVKQHIFIKRDDLTDVGLGGNKNRKLDYLLADALKSNADTIITVGGKQSNHCRQTLAYAKALGLDCHLVLDGADDDSRQGNLFVFGVFGATLHFVELESDFDYYIEELSRSLKHRGKRPYVIPMGGSTATGALGYVDSAEEIARQSHSFDANIGCIFLATGSCGTQAGTVAGAKQYLPDAQVYGIAVSGTSADKQKRVAGLANQTCELLGLPQSFKESEIVVDDKYYGTAYGVPCESGNEAVKILGKTQGILLDPVYTGKAFGGLLDLLRSDKLDNGKDIVFIHTGGSPAIYNFVDSFRL